MMAVDRNGKVGIMFCVNSRATLMPLSYAFCEILLPRHKAYHLLSISVICRALCKYYPALADTEFYTRD